MATAGSATARRGAKRRKCDSYVIFEKNLKRSRAFILIFGQENRPQGAPSNEERELLRGALVFAIGALDNFVHELILEIVPKFGGDKSSMKQPLAAIAKADPGLSLRVALAGPDGAAQEFREALDAWLESQSFHGVAKILGALGYVGIQLDETSLPADWKKKLEGFTDDRHKIVHRGSTKVVKRDDANNCCDLVENIATAINLSAVTFYH